MVASSAVCRRKRNSRTITRSGSPICRTNVPRWSPTRARSANVLVNVEDVLPLCDFHTPAVLRRGQLTLAAGTGGASPAVARAARERLEAAFPESWGACAQRDCAIARRVAAEGGRLRCFGRGRARASGRARPDLTAHGSVFLAICSGRLSRPARRWRAGHGVRPGLDVVLDGDGRAAGRCRARPSTRLRFSRPAFPALRTPGAKT